MFCPRCSQEQTSPETKFCSRCGLPLNLISEVLSNGGTLPHLLETKQNASFFHRRNGLVFSLFWFVFFVLLLAPLFGIIDVDELAAAAALIGVMGGFLWLLVSFFLLPKTVKIPELPSQNINNFNQSALGGSFQTALPPQQTPTAESYSAPANLWKAPVTGEFAKPGSVTEATTKLLKKDE